MKMKYLLVSFFVFFVSLFIWSSNSRVVKAQSSASFTIENVSLENPKIGDEFNVNVHTSAVDSPFYSADLGINFDKNVFEVVNVEWNISNWMMVFNPNHPICSLAISAASAYQYKGNADIATIKLRVKKLPATATTYQFNWAKLSLDESTVLGSGVNGVVTFKIAVITPSPRPTPLPMPIIRVCDKRLLYCPVFNVR